MRPKIFFLVYLLSLIILVGAGCGRSNSAMVGSRAGAGAPKRVVVGCDIFGKAKNIGIDDKDLQQAAAEYVAGYKEGDRGYLPKDLIDVADQSTLCGSIADKPSDYPYLHSASFYISSLSPEEVFAFFRSKLALRQCEAGELVVPSYDTNTRYLPFTCKDGHGNIVPDYSRQSYAINFDLNKNEK